MRVPEGSPEVWPLSRQLPQPGRAALFERRERLVTAPVRQPDYWYHLPLRRRQSVGEEQLKA